MQIPPIVSIVLASIALNASASAKGPRPVPEGIVGQLFDETSGVLEVGNIFGPGYPAFNRLGRGLLLVVTVDLGKDCIMKTLSNVEAIAVAKGKAPPPSRPTRCGSPSGALRVNVSYTSVSSESRQVMLAPFGAAEDGKVRVPIFFYRNHACSALRVRASVTGSPVVVEETVDFGCGE